MLTNRLNASLAAATTMMRATRWVPGWFAAPAVRAVAIVLFAAIGLAGCDSASKISDSKLVMVNVEEGQRLVAGERTLLHGKRSAVWVDARSKTDFDAGHIPGAINLPFEFVSTEYVIIENELIIIVYGADYNDARANGMSKRLKQLIPSADIRTLDGGIRAWTAAGNELEKSGG
jgi:rhodanese-related sulfurtransferase